MTKDEVKLVRHGLYRVFWKGGGSSLASVGSLADGRRWLSPCNWVSGPSTDWHTVERVEMPKEDTYEERS